VPDFERIREIQRLTKIADDNSQTPEARINAARKLLRETNCSARSIRVAKRTAKHFIRDASQSPEVRKRAENLLEFVADKCKTEDSGEAEKVSLPAIPVPPIIPALPASPSVEKEPSCAPAVAAPVSRLFSNPPQAPKEVCSYCGGFPRNQVPAHDCLPYMVPVDRAMNMGVLVGTSIDAPVIRTRSGVVPDTSRDQQIRDRIIKMGFGDALVDGGVLFDGKKISFSEWERQHRHLA